LGWHGLQIRTSGVFEHYGERVIIITFIKPYIFGQMKKISFLILFLYCFVYVICQNKQSQVKNISPKPNTTSCKFQNDNVVDLGIGVAVWNYVCDKNIIIYSDIDLKNKIYDFNVCNNAQNAICPLFFKSDYGIFHFVVTMSSKKMYKIIYNDNKIGYISANSVFNFVNWNSFLVNYTTGIRVKGQNFIYKVKYVNGNLVSVVDEETNRQKKLIWKNKNKLLIDILLFE